MSDDSTTLKAMRLRLYPTPEQKIQLKQMAGSTRWLWNHLLALNIAQYNKDKTFIFWQDMSGMLPGIKGEHQWLYNTPGCSLQRVTKYLSNALPRKITPGKGFPKFKKKSLNRDSFYITNQGFKIDQDIYRVKIPNMKTWLKYRTNKKRRPPDVIESATVSQDGDRWSVSITYKVPKVKPINKEKLSSVGIDLGINSLAVTSDEYFLENPKFYKKAEKHLIYLQQKVTRCEKGSKNREKAQLKLYRHHRKIRNRREDTLHKFSAFITTKYDLICVEDLDVQKMMKDKRFAKSIGDAGWGELLRQIQYKAEWQGKYFVKIDRFAASTQTCSSCGDRHPMTIDMREYDCPTCSMSMDRDLNAAINIKQMGTTKFVGCETPEIGAISASMPEESLMTRLWKYFRKSIKVTQEYPSVEKPTKG